MPVSGELDYNFMSRALVLGVNTIGARSGYFGYSSSVGLVPVKPASIKPYFSYNLADYVLTYRFKSLSVTDVRLDDYKESVERLNRLVPPLHMASNRLELEGEVFKAESTKIDSIQGGAYYLVDAVNLVAKYNGVMIVFTSDMQPMGVIKSCIPTLNYYKIFPAYIHYPLSAEGYIVIKSVESLRVGRLLGEEETIMLTPEHTEVYTVGEMPILSEEIKALLKCI